MVLVQGYNAYVAANPQVLQGGSAVGAGDGLTAMDATSTGGGQESGEPAVTVAPDGRRQFSEAFRAKYSYLDPTSNTVQVCFCRLG